MKNFICFFILMGWLFLPAQEQQATFNISPVDFRVNNQVTITITNVDPALWNAGQPDNIYLWAWSFNLGGAQAGDALTNGSWVDSNEIQKLTNNGGGSYSYTFTPSSLFGTTNISKIGFLVKADNGSSTGNGEKKSQNMSVKVKLNELTLTSPSEYLTVVDSGTSISVAATSAETANFTLKANGSTVNTNNGTNYTFNYLVTSDTNLVLEANDGQTTLSESFVVKLTPANPVPNDMLDGLNLDPNDNSKATLVLYAPGKSTVHVIGDFNNWQTNASYLMKKDTARDKFWIELSGLSQGNHMYQYLVDNSIKIADPYSTIILDESNDSFISSTTYPNLPAYPSGLTSNPVTHFSNNATEYNWQITNFQKPEKTDLVIFELLIRDFDAAHSFDAVKSRLDYLENLGINAVELMPISEFDGNLSWGYSPAFHMALDKYYGTSTALKEFIDACHARGMAVIVDVVYNHATGQNPFYRMWNTDNGGTGGQASSLNPFFNETPKHAYNVFNDFNHQSRATQAYVERTVKYWLEEYKIDGLRWDLTKGFTQNCSASDEGCTGAYQKDRVEVLKKYADFQWEVDSGSYVIFEHLGGTEEEKEWADYRVNEGKGIMLWNNLNGNYNEATMGFHDNGKSNFSNVSYKNKGFDGPSAVSYMESHDEERLMYKNLQFGNVNGGYSIKSANTALERMEIAGAFFFTVPGPKMIWQFGELGYEFSINRCSDGSVDNSCRTDAKPIRWEYFNNSNRKAIYDTWSRLIDLRLNEAIFKTDNFTMDLGRNDGLKSIQLTLDSATGNTIKYVTILGNFGVTTQTINTNFKETGTWYDLMDATGATTINGSTTSVSLDPGVFKIYGNQASTLSMDSFEKDFGIKLYPNPASTSFQINKAVDVISIYDITGKTVKTFKGHFSKGHAFDISNLPASIYLVKVKSNLEVQSTLKIVKTN